MTSKITSLNVTVIGDGSRTVVFGNGLGTTQHSWRHQVEALRNDCRMVLLDYVGTPDSDLSAYRAERYDTLYGHADDVIALLDEMDLTDVTFVGHSVGGMIGALTALSSPDRVTQLITIAASPRYLNDSTYYGGVTRQMVDEVLASANADYHTWVSGFSPLVIGDHSATHLIDEFGSVLRRMRPDIANQALKAIFLSDFRDLIPRIKQHVTVVQSRDDFVVPVQVGEYLASHFPSATFRLLAVTGHLPQLACPEQINAVLFEALGLVRDDA